MPTENLRDKPRQLFSAQKKQDMAVYVDFASVPYKGKARHHMTADSLPELHFFCESLGISRAWYHKATTHPHYDITSQQREAAIAAGAIPVTSRELLLAAKYLVKKSSTSQNIDQSKRNLRHG